MSRRITAAVSDGGGQALELREVLLDSPAEGELLIEVAACGICHTDLSAVENLPGPAVFGHEGAGTVVEVGAGVGDFRVGDRVVATFGSCGHCESCEDGSPAYCWRHGELNVGGRRSDGSATLRAPSGEALAGAFFQQSAFATHALATTRNVVRIPDALPFEAAAPLGCAVQTGAGAVLRQLRPRVHQSLVVFGAGAVGLAAIMAAASLNVATIVAVDLVPGRLALAKTLGATMTFSAGSAELVGELREATGGGAHYSIDSAATVDSFQTAVRCLRPRGVCGVLSPPTPWGTPVPHPGGETFMFTRLHGLVEGDSDPATFIPELAQGLLDGTLPYQQLVTTFAFGEINAALAAMKHGEVIKPVIVF